MVTSNPSFFSWVGMRKPYYGLVEKYGHINIRDSFFGGRTNNVSFNYVCKSNERIKYYDFTSLYPYVLVAYKYPIEHPKFINFFYNKEIKDYFGFIKCIITPPEGLFLPVLPVRNQNKLLFPLCGKCVETRGTKCSHTGKERNIVGTWTSVEVKYALERGYEIDTLIEVLDYDSMSDGIFKKYIQTFLKLKTESSDWPADCDTEEKKVEFLEEFNRKEGKFILIDYSNF